MQTSREMLKVWGSNLLPIPGLQRTPDIVEGDTTSLTSESLAGNGLSAPWIIPGCAYPPSASLTGPVPANVS